MNLELVSIQVCVLALAALVLVLPGRSGAKPRLDSLEPVTESRPEPVGSAVLIASLIALVRNGSDLVEAFEELAGRRFAELQAGTGNHHSRDKDYLRPQRPRWIGHGKEGSRGASSPYIRIPTTRLAS